MKHIFFVLLFAFCGCTASVSTVSEEEEIESKQLKPQQGKALLFIIRKSQLMGGARHCKVLVNDVLVGHFAPGTYIPLNLDPGAHRLLIYTTSGKAMFKGWSEVSGIKNGLPFRYIVHGSPEAGFGGVGSLWLNAVAEKTYYVAFDTSPGSWDVQLVGDDEGRGYIENYDRSAEQYNASKKVTFEGRDAYDLDNGILDFIPAR